MTAGARTGNWELAQKDFGKGVQHAYSQLVSNIKFLKDSQVTLRDEHGAKIEKPTFRFAYPMIVLSDHYPALYMQTKHLLKEAKVPKTVLNTFVGDVFVLDELTEFLDSPLKFLSYLRLHAEYKDRINANGEHTVLGYHLKQNLWFDDEYHFITIADDCAADLEAAFCVRRDGLEGNDTPSGILTASRGNYIDSIIEQLENVPNSAALELGFILLETAADSLLEVNRQLDERRRTCLNGKECCDFSIQMEQGRAGYTVHITSSDIATTDERLRAHCEFRKNEAKAKSWYGIALEPQTMQITVAARLEHPNVLSNPLRTASSGKYKFTPKMTSLDKSKRKFGRNDSCPCGSGKKYKKCCLSRTVQFPISPTSSEPF